MFFNNFTDFFFHNWIHSGWNWLTLSLIWFDFFWQNVFVYFPFAGRSSDSLLFGYWTRPDVPQDGHRQRRTGPEPGPCLQLHDGLHVLHVQLSLSSIYRQYDGSPGAFSSILHSFLFFLLIRSTINAFDWNIPYYLECADLIRLFYLLTFLLAISKQNIGSVSKSVGCHGRYETGWSVGRGPLWSKLHGRVGGPTVWRQLRWQWNHHCQSYQHHSRLVQ